MQLEETAHEAGDEQQVLAPVGEVLRSRLTLIGAGQALLTIVAVDSSW